MDVDTIRQIHLAIWTVACIMAFIVYYCYEEYRVNKEFENQLHSLSGVIVFNKPLFGTLMCGFGGAIIMLVSGRIDDDPCAMVLLILMFTGLIALVNYDVRKHRSVHFVSLGLLIAAGSVFLVWVDLNSVLLLAIYFGVAALFVVVIVLNFSCTAWKPPFMTLQALLEIVWVFMLGLCVIVFAVSDGPIEIENTRDHTANHVLFGHNLTMF